MPALKHLMMLTLPNSGSTWFAATLAKHLPGCRYYDKEFFNPVCNLKHELVLRRNFGSELVCRYHNIAAPADDRTLEDIDKTWGTEDYTFDKECQSPFKLPVFVERFHVFVLLRHTDLTFPPSRVRVWSFYEHAWFALKAHNHHLSAVKTVDRAREAHRVMAERLEHDALIFSRPILYHEKLFLPREELSAELLKVTGFTSDPLVDEIIATRRSKGATT